MGDRKTLGVHIDDESDLYENFETYKERGGFTSNSEALRQVLRNQFEDDDAPVGVAAALSQLAGERLQEQVGLLGRYMTYLAIALLALQVGIPGTPVWYGMGAVFGFLTFTTFLGVATGVAEHLNPDGVASSSDTAADEVEA